MPRQNNERIPHVGFGAKTFPKFNRLPPEIRLMIWEEAAHTPRIIRIDVSGKHKEQHRRRYMRINGQIREQVSPLFIASRDSRAVAMREDLIYFSILRHERSSTINRHFVITSNDIVFIIGGRDRYLHLRTEGDAHKIANIMVGASAYSIQKSGNSGYFTRLGANIITAFGNHESLERFYCLVHNSSSSKLRSFDLTDLGLFSPHQFKCYTNQLADWLGANKKDSSHYSLVGSNTFSTLWETAWVRAWAKQHIVCKKRDV
ncbi:hypothetical protein F5Y19DRAFT_489501 [Xylariaceae sp. FL1651]|nr:hypothetical protein F5Y19DRAFT_489501 [Xylariaceae sp. FL1651]